MEVEEKLVRKAAVTVIDILERNSYSVPIVGQIKKEDKAHELPCRLGIPRRLEYHICNKVSEKIYYHIVYEDT